MRLGYFGLFWGILGYFADWRAGIRARGGTGGQAYVQGGGLEGRDRCKEGDWRAGIHARGGLEGRDTCKEGDWRAGIDMGEGVTWRKELHGAGSYMGEGVSIRSQLCIGNSPLNWEGGNGRRNDILRGGLSDNRLPQRGIPGKGGSAKKAQGCLGKEYSGSGTNLH